MKIILLGTGTSQGVPVIACKCSVCTSKDEKDKRYRSSVLVEIDSKIFLIDAGPDFRSQLLKSNVQNLDAILLTHEHVDHIIGLDDVRAFNYILNKEQFVYASKPTIEAVKRVFHYAFDPKYAVEGLPKINLNIIENCENEILGIKIQTILVKHGKMDVYGFRINDFTYITDANYISPEEMKKIEGTKILIINSLRIDKHSTHFNLSESIETIQKIKPQKAYITHISHLMGKHKDIQKILPPNIYLGYDGQIIYC